MVAILEFDGGISIFDALDFALFFKNDRGVDTGAGRQHLRVDRRAAGRCVDSQQQSPQLRRDGRGAVKASHAPGWRRPRQGSDLYLGHHHVGIASFGA